MLMTWGGWCGKTACDDFVLRHAGHAVDALQVIGVRMNPADPGVIVPLDGETVRRAGTPVLAAVFGLQRRRSVSTHGMLITPCDERRNATSYHQHSTFKSVYAV